MTRRTIVQNQWRRAMAARKVTQFGSEEQIFGEEEQAPTGYQATKKRSATRSGSRRLPALPEDEFHETMTLQEAKSIARHLGLTVRQVRYALQRRRRGSLSLQ